MVMECDKKLLLVDDDLIKFADIFQSSFKGHGVEVTMAEDFDGAIEALKNTDFDLIIIDIGLIGPFNGIDLLKAMREIDKKIPIHILTAYGDEYRKDAESLGANKYFSKPLDLKKHILEPLGVFL